MMSMELYSTLLEVAFFKSQKNGARVLQVVGGVPTDSRPSRFGEDLYRTHYSFA